MDISHIKISSFTHRQIVSNSQHTFFCILEYIHLSISARRPLEVCTHKYIEKHKPHTWDLQRAIERIIYFM